MSTLATSSSHPAHGGASPVSGGHHPAHGGAGRSGGHSNAPRALRLAWYGGLGLMLLVALWAFVQRVQGGLAVTNLSSYVPWGAWVAFYIYFVGLSAGAFLLSSLVYVFGMEEFERLGRSALLMATVSMGVALAFIGVDLGRMDRALLPLIFGNWASPLAWEVRFYGLYVTLLVAELVLALRPFLRPLGPEALAANRRWLRRLGIIGVPIAIFGVHGGTGTIFAVVKARAVWFGGLFPVIFVASALVSGTALLTVIYYLHRRANRQPVDAGMMARLGSLLFGFLLLDLGLTFYEFVVPLLAKQAHDVEIFHLMAEGPFAWVFWWGQMFLAFLVPSVLLAFPALRRLPGLVAAVAAMVVVGIVAVRFNIVVPPLIPPVLPGLPEGYYHPTLIEWLLSFGLMAAGALGYSLVAELLPIHAEEEAPGAATDEEVEAA